MGDKLYEENSVQAIAESIRSKLGVDTTYKIAEMSGAINTIVIPDGTTNITENGYHDVKAYEQAYVHVEGGITPTGTTNIYENGDHDVTNYATAHVAVPQPIGKKTVTENGTDIDIAQYATLDVIVEPNLGTKTVNQNGVYNASDDNLDGYSKVTVSTPVPTGKKNIVQNGTDIDVSSYALVDVAVPEPVGKKTITENGTNIDIAAYATADVIVQPNVGTKSITENGTYNASADNLDGYSQVTVTTPVPTGTKQITANGTNIDVAQYATADVQVDPNVGTKSITNNGTYNASSDSLDGYSTVTVNVPPDLGFRDKTIIPDKYNTGCHGYLTPFDLASDTSNLHYNTPSGNLELKFNTQYSSVIRDVDPTQPIIYRNIDFTAYPQFQFMQCGDCHKEDANYTAGVVIIFENCLFRKVYSNSSFTSADMIQFEFINCTMEYFNISNSILMNCLIGNKTFYHTAFGDEVLEDGIGVNDYTTIANSYIMDIEPVVSASGSAHFDGLQCTYEHTDYTLYNVRFECMNMPYDPKGGGWTQAVNFEHVTTNLIISNCIINGGGYYATGIKKGSNQTLTDNLIGATYNGACYPSDQVYQLTDGFATTYTNLYVSSVFFDGKDISIVCTNDSSSARTLTVKGYNAQSSSPVTTLTYTVPACPTYNTGWTGITEWDDLPFDKIYKVEHALSFYGINKIECYDGDTKIRTWYLEESAIPVDKASFQSITSNGTYNTEDKARVIVNVPSSVSGTKQITANGTGIDVAEYAYADVSVQPNVGTKSITENGTYNASSDSLDGYSQVTVNVAGSELGFRDKLIIPDTYNTGSHGYLTPFDLSGDTSGLLWQEADNSLKLDFNTASKQTIYNVDTTTPVVYRNVDFTAYKSLSIANANMCSKSDQYYKAGVQIVFENCLFRNVDAPYPFASQDMIQFAFMNCSVESFKLSNAYVERCLIGNRTFYKTKYSDTDAEDGIKLMSYDTFVNSYVMDVEPEPDTAGEAHYDGLQFSTDVDNTVLYNVRFECMNMPYNPKGGGWSYSVFYQALANNSYMNYCIFHGGGLYGTSIKKNSTLSLVGNLIGAGYSTPCYPGEDIYQLTDDGLDTYDTLLVSSVFFDGKNLHIICTNDYTSAKTLTVRQYAIDGYSYTTKTFNIPACPSVNSGWSGIDEWSDLPFDIDCTIHDVFNIGKIECYDGNTKIRTWFFEEGVPVPSTEAVKAVTTNGLHDVTDYSTVNVNGLLPTYVKNAIETDYTNGYVDTNGKWIYQYPSNNYSDIYAVENGKTYRLMFGATVGNRARGCLTTVDVRTQPAGSEVQGTFVGTSQSVQPGNGFTFTSSIDGYLVFQKSNTLQTGVNTYFYCIDEMTDLEPSGTKSITANGDGIDVAGYSTVNVHVPGPSGILPITENGIYDVTNYASASVSVSGGGGLPSDMQIVNVSVTSDVTGITISYDNTRSVAMLFVIPDILQGTAYEITFMMAKMNFYTGAAELDQIYGTLFNYNYSGEQPYQNANMGSVTVDSTNATITINGKGSNYKFKAGDTFRVLIVYGGID